MRYGVLGPLEVADEHGQELALGGPKQRSVFAILLLHAGEVVSSDRLVDLLWGECPPASATKTLQVYVSNLRKTLGAGVLITRPGGYVLRTEPGEVDLERFAALAAEGRAALRAGDPEGAAKSLREALGLWRGAPLADLEYASFAQSEIARLVEMRLAALEDRVDAEVALGDHGAVIGELGGLVREHPLRERLRGQLMLALYRSGRQTDALAAYRELSDLLRDELGLEPGEGLRELERLILRHDPALAAAALPPPQPGTLRAPATDTIHRLKASEAMPPHPIVLRRSRKLVTALFCELTASTARGAELDPELFHGLMDRYLTELRAAIGRHGGVVDRVIGEAVMAVFGVPRVHEDDALRAVRAAAEIRDRVSALAEEVDVTLSFRAAVNTGLVLVGEERNLAIGDPVTVAARLGQAAASGEILVGTDTLRFVRDAIHFESLEPLELQGRAEPVSAFRLVRVDPLAPGLARRLDTRLVGRERELGLLRAGWQRTLDELGCHLFTLLGVAGVGKSRLVSELLASVGEHALVLSGRCLPYGEGITFWPLVEALTGAGKRAQAMLDRLERGWVAAPEELFWEVRLVLEALAAELPVILHIDDLQWGQPMLFDLLDHVADLSRNGAILLLCAARPELLDQRPGWGGGKLNATTMLLEPLAPADAEALLNDLGDGLASDVRARVVKAAEGNPLFLEVMASLAPERDAAAAIPATIQALLTACVEQLDVGDRELLEHGAVEGEVFHSGTLRALAGSGSSGDVGLRLARLVRRQLIRPHPATIGGDDAFRFRHLLLRDVTYEGLPKATRAVLHERFATWLETSAAGMPELDEIAGWHLEQAVRYTREMRRAVVSELEHRAVERLFSAGMRAGRRGDDAAAITLLTRALELAAQSDPLRSRIAVELAPLLQGKDDFARLDELLRIAEADPDVRTSAAPVRAEWLMMTNPHKFATTVPLQLPALLDELQARGDDLDIAKTHIVAAKFYILKSQCEPWAREALIAAEHARRAGHIGLHSKALVWAIQALVTGPWPFAEAAMRAETLAEEIRPRYLTVLAQQAPMQLAASRGDLQTAREIAQQVIAELRDELGMPFRATTVMRILAEIELAAGNPSAARATLLQVDALHADAGESAFRSTIQARLAEAEETLGNRAAAETALELCDQLGAAEDEINLAITGIVRARLALANGDPEAAEQWARTAVEHAFMTDAPIVRADATLGLAHVLSGLGRHDEAAAEAQAALDLYLQKGDVLRAERARAMLTDARKVKSPNGAQA
jgi:DNA-binding SARP family transcriptional activator/class 3 adenylate cyclase